MVSVSPYLHISPKRYVNESNVRRVPAFDSAEARMLTLSPEIAEAMKADDTSSLGNESREALIRTGLLGHSVEHFRREAYDRMASASRDDGNASFVLLPSSYCNMGCEYCGQEHFRGGVSSNHRDAVISRVAHKIHDPSIHNVKVKWFGGEPLMRFATIRSMSQQFVRRAELSGTEYSASIITNGALLDERKLSSLVSACKVSEFHITIDGPEEIHDAHRPLKSGQRSYQRLVGFLEDAVSDERFREVLFVFRTNIDVNNSGYVSACLTEMAERGFAGRKNVQFSLAPIHPWGNDISELEVALNDYASAEESWLRQTSELGLECRNLPSAPKARTCSATDLNSEVVSSTGSLFSCTEYPLVPHHEENSVLIPIENLLPGRDRPRGEFDDWPARVRNGDFPCTKCWFLPSCGGSCPKQWMEGTPACPSTRLNIDTRLDIEMVSRGWTACA